MTQDNNGSSPLTRGKRGRRRKGIDLRRLIPAHAGKTPSRGCPRRTCTAHPRSRGENRVGGDAPACAAGSSPLTRGKLLGFAFERTSAGLIPAHAGKTVDVAVSFSGSPAHPRSRGENDVEGEDHAGEWGSSPLTRGKHVRAHALPQGRRLIPAHAGKT